MKQHEQAASRRSGEGDVEATVKESEGMGIHSYK